MSALTELSKKHGAYGGSTTAESGSALSSLKAKRGLESLNASIDYGTLKDREDFGKYSELTPSWSLNPRDDYGLVFNSRQNSGLSGIGNKVQKVLAPLSGNDTGVKYQYMTDDEVKNYAYLHNAPGFTKEDAEEYLKSLDLDKRMTTDYEEKLKDYAGKNALTKTISTIGSTGYNAIGGLSKLMNIPGEALNAAISGDKFDVSAYNASSLPQNVGNALSQGVEDSIDGNVGKFLYGTGKSILDSGLQMLLYGPASTFTMGSSAAVSRMRELEDLGASDLQMVIGSALSGAIEMLTEKYSVENLLKSKGIDSLKSFLKETGKQMFTEGTEEAFSEILNAVVDRTADALGGVSDYKNFVDDYVANGGIEADAGKAYFWQKVKDTGLSALGGAISGGLMGAGGNAIQWSGNVQSGNEIAKNGRQSDLVNLLKEKGRDDLVEKIQNGNNASLGAAELDLLRDAGEKAEKKKATEEDKNAYYELLDKTSGLYTSKTGASDLEGNPLKIKNIDFEKETYETDKGTKKFSEVKLTDSLATEINLAEDIPSEQRESFLENYKGGNIGDYSTYFELAYQYGKAGYEDAAMRLVEEGHLTSEQMLNIYEAGLRDESSQVSKLNSRIKAVETRNKLFADTKLSAKVDDSVISYDGTDSTKIDYNSLTENQKQNVILSQAFAKAFNANVTLFNSKENNAVYNGLHDEGTNTIYLDVYSTNTGTNGKSTTNAILTTMSHELTHWGKVNAPAAYEELKETILPVILREKSLEIGGEVTRDMLSDVYSDEYHGLSNEKIEDELVARACENMLQNSEYAKEALRKLSDETKHTFIDKVKDFYKKIVAAIKDILGRADSNSKEYRMLSRNLSELEKAQKLWDEVIKESSENTLKRDAEIASEENGPESGNIDYSLKENDRITEKSLEYYLAHKGTDSAHIGEDMLKEANSIVSKMAEHMLPYLDIKNNNGKRYLPEEILGKTTFANGSYGRTIENTTICFRTLAYIDFTNEIKEKIGRPLTVDESFLASQMLYDIAKEPQCLYCYVSLDRKAYDGFLLDYIKQRDEVIDNFSKLKNKNKKNIDNLYQEFLHGRKPTKDMQARFNLWINTAVNGEKFISLSDITTEETRSRLKNGELAEQIFDAERYAQSASWAKKLEQYRSYNGDILNMTESTVKKLNKHYGLRFYSFSEYTPAFIVENMQQIRDASLKGLYGLAYTKKTDFARIFANTGMNINISTFGKMVNGEVVPDTAQGADWNEVKELRKQYKNVGAVFVATSDELTRWALNQDWIDVVIPFHIVRTGASVAEFYKWTNNTAFQADKNASGKNKTITPAEHHNDRATFEKLIKDRGLTPRFSQFLDEPNYMKLVNETRLSDRESSKLVPNFTEETYKAAVKSFDAFVNDGGYYGDWYKEGIDYDKALNVVSEDILAGKKANEVEYGRQDINIDDQKRLIDLYKKRPKEKAHGQQLSLKDSSGNTLSEGQQKYFKDSKVRDENGNLKVMYHGTYSSPFTIFNPAKSDDGRSLFFTDNESVARTYERGRDNGTLFKVYLDIKNPLVIDGKGAYWNKIKIADGEIVNVKPRTYRDFTFINQKDADNFAKKFNIEELETKYDEAKENGTAEYNGENLDKWEIDNLLQEELEKADKEYRKYRYSNSKKTTFREFFDNYEKYGWYDLEAVLREYDHNAASLEEIKEYSTYKEAVEETKRLFDDYVKEEGEGTFYDDMMASLLPTSGSFESGAEYLNTRGIAERAQREGHDGVIINNISDTAYGGYAPSTIVITFNSNQVKDITNLNPTENDDIYLSLKDNASELTTGDMISILMQNPNLKEKYRALYESFFKEDEQRLGELERLRKMEAGLDLNMINDKKVKAYASQLLRDMHSSFDQAELEKRLKNFYLHFGDEDFTIEDIQRDASVLSKRIIAESLQSDVNETAKKELEEFRKALGTYNIKLSEQQKRELRYIYGSDWMKQFIGKVKIRSTGTSLDTLWGEFMNEYGTLFSETTESDQGVRLAEVLNGLYDKSAYTDKWNDRQREEYEKMLANELLDSLYTVTDSAAEKYIAKTRKLSEQYNKKLVALGLRKGKSEISSDDIYTDYAKALREEYAKFRKEYDERQIKRITRDRIIEKAKKLNQRLQKKDKELHIPEVLEQPLVNVLRAIQLQNYPSESVALEFVNLVNAFDKISTQEDALTNIDVYFNTDGYFKDSITGIVDEINDKAFKLSETLQNEQNASFKLIDLSLNSLRAVNDFLSAINTASKQYDMALASSNNMRISPRGNSSMDMLEKLGKKTTEGKGLVEKFKDFLGWENVTQIYAFDRFGEGGKETFKAIMEGQDKLALNTKTIIEYAKSAFSGEQLDNWEKETHEFVRDGKKYTVTSAQLMSLYCLSKRQGARQHLYETRTSKGESVHGQGIVISAYETKKNIQTRSDVIGVDENFVKYLTNMLTPEQKAVADKLQRFMATTCSDWGNFVTMKRFGIMQFTEDDYFPMRVNREAKDVEGKETPQGATIFRMLNASFTKSLDEKANGALYLDSIFDVFTSHSSDMAMYNAMGLPVLDAYRWLSYKRDEGGKSTSLKQRIREVYGEKGKQWILTYLEDMNGQRVRASSAEQIASTFMRNYKTAAVAANIRVALMQPTAYLKALAVMDNKYLSRAFFEMRPSQLKVAVAEMNSKSPLAMWKNELNMYDLNVGSSIEQKIKQTKEVKNIKGAVEKTMEWSMKLAEKADEVTWAKLYRACQLEIEDSGIPKGEAFDVAVNERFREVCFRTQVFDSINSRSELMRKKDMWAKILTSFASEPSLSYSMLSSEVFNYLIEARTDKNQAFSNHVRPMARNTVAFLITEIAVSLVAAVPDVLREDEDAETFIRQYLKNAISNFGSDMVLLPFMRDIVSAIQGFDPSRPDEEIFTSAVRAGRSLMDGKWNYRDIYNSLKFVSQGTGIPLSNVVRDVVAVWNKFIGEPFGLKVE